MDAARVTPYFRLEDVYLVSLCARKAGVCVISSDKIFTLNRRCSYNPFCAIKQATWLTHTPEDIVAADRNVRKFYIPTTNLSFNGVASMYNKSAFMYQLLEL